jgi:hypothetical protein
VRASWKRSDALRFRGFSAVLEGMAVSAGISAA